MRMGKFSEREFTYTQTVVGFVRENNKVMQRH